MLEQINNLIGESDTEMLAELYTNIFYSCFADIFVSDFFQTGKAFILTKATKEHLVDVMATISSEFDNGLPIRPSDSIKFYELLNVVGGNRKMAKISPVIQFKVSPKDFLNVEKWLNSLCAVLININITSKSRSDNTVEETFSVKDLKIIESYKVENLVIAETVNGSVVDTSNKTPAVFIVTVSDWIVDALSKDYLRLNVVEKLLYRPNLLPIVE